MRPDNTATVKYNIATLANGLRVIHLPSASPVVFCGYSIGAGTRHEQNGEEGLAHFCEHATFKGTVRRSSVQIINALERLGGDLNAYTNKEETVYYAAITREHIANAVNVLTDIVFNSTYPDTELKKEIEVVCDEIESYNDSPAELIYDEFENMVFAGHPLGHSILGTAKHLRTYTHDNVADFARRMYTPNRMVFFAYGDIEFAKLLRLLEKCSVWSEKCGVRSVECEVNECAESQHFSSTPHSSSTPHHVVKSIDSHQAHVMIGSRSYSLHDERRLALCLLNNILGGPGMNSRLNLALRERCGLVYTVESSAVSYTDTGVWSIYFGCAPKDVKRCMRIVRRELDKMMLRPLSNTQLANAKRQIKGQMAIACDNRESFALDFGKNFLHFGCGKDQAELNRKIDALTAEQLQAVACDLFSSDKLYTLVYK